VTGATLEQRIRRLEDIEAITTLTARYGRAVDKRPGRGIDLAAIPHIFTAAARWSSDGLGTTVGASAIAAELPSATATVEFSMHAFLNPMITIDGDAATGSWLLWIASVHHHRPGTVYLSADMTYARTAAGWFIDSVFVYDGIRVPDA
jgi:SnoaL-like domain